MATPTVANWGAQILQGVGAPVTPNNLKLLAAWQQSEGGTASNNPLNTTQPGGTTYNGSGVQNYGDWHTGLGATIATLKNGHYGNILTNLMHNADPMATARAIAASPWGTGSLVERVLGGGVAPNPIGVQPAVAGVNGTGNPMKPAVAANVPAGTPDDSYFNNIRQNLAGYSQGKQPTSLIQAAVQGKLEGTAGKPQTLIQMPSGLKVQTDHSAPLAPATGGIVQQAEKFLGTPYKWGGADPKTGFDCSGFAQYLYGKQGVSIPRTTYDQWQSGQGVPQGSMKPGDLVFFKGSDSRVENGKTLPGHVGIFIGNGQYIQAPHTGDVIKISQLSDAKDFMGARRYGGK